MSQPRWKTHWSHQRSTEDLTSLKQSIQISDKWTSVYIVFPTSWWLTHPIACLKQAPIISRHVRIHFHFCRQNTHLVYNLGWFFGGFSHSHSGLVSNAPFSAGDPLGSSCQWFFQVLPWSLVLPSEHQGPGARELVEIQIWVASFHAFSLETTISPGPNPGSGNSKYWLRYYSLTLIGMVQYHI